MQVCINPGQSVLGLLGCHGITQVVLNIRGSFLWYETETAPCLGDTFDTVDTSCSLWSATESHVSQLIFMRFEMVTTITCKACFKDYQDSSAAQKNYSKINTKSYETP